MILHFRYIISLPFLSVYFSSSLFKSIFCLFVYLSSPCLPVYAPHPCLQGHFDSAWCRCQAADSKLSISLSNGVTAGLCWPLNSLRWRRWPPAAALVWHSLLAACLFSARRSHFRVKSWVWQRRTFNAGDWSIWGEIWRWGCLHTSSDRAGVSNLVVPSGLSLQIPPRPRAHLLLYDLCLLYFLRQFQSTHKR